MSIPEMLKSDLEAVVPTIDWTKTERLNALRALLERNDLLAERVFYGSPRWWGVDLARAPQAASASPNDPDGALVPLPQKAPPGRILSHPEHDFIGALLKPWVPVA